MSESPAPSPSLLEPFQAVPDRAIDQGHAADGLPHIDGLLTVTG
jgi:hypothetical protein